MSRQIQLQKVTVLKIINWKIKVFFKVSRLTTGPEIRGCRPVLVQFLNFKDREEVLSKTKLLKSSNIYVSEDLSRKTREQRTELFKYIRFVSRLFIKSKVSKTLTFRLRRRLLTRSASFVTTSSTLTTTVTCLTKARAGSSGLSRKLSRRTTGPTPGRLSDRSPLWQTSPSLPCQASPGRRVFTRWVTELVASFDTSPPRPFKAP